jgi:hypothetical protein
MSGVNISLATRGAGEYQPVPGARCLQAGWDALQGSVQSVDEVGMNLLERRPVYATNDDSV